MLSSGEARTGQRGRLTEHATAWLRDVGMRVAMIDTGGDAGHAPARCVYLAVKVERFPAKVE
ncbi:hypothetical protein AB852_13915 [Streptomyces uncialis]|uniref:Uncharacterized protein n=1 Tax=Streptomyces uncialis TaxID=1048205 RepID=A0A1Q4V7J5_9ACTN|nr:hypothetical protein AB852_13915 [Streptomyces uncialis]